MRCCPHAGFPSIYRSNTFRSSSPVSIKTIRSNFSLFSLANARSLSMVANSCILFSGTEMDCLPSAETLGIE